MSGMLSAGETGVGAPAHDASPNEAIAADTPRPAPPRKMFGTTRRPASTSFRQRWRDQHGPALPDPFWQAKFMVFVILALAVWAFYVVVGRACARIIMGTSATTISRATGIGILVGWVILWLMFVWTYVRIITATPGIAVKHVPKATSPPPLPDQSQAYIPYQAPAPHSSDQSTVPPSTSFGAFAQSTAAPGEFHQRMTSDPDGPDPSDFGLIANALHTTFNQDSSPASSTTVENTGRASHEPSSTSTLAPYPPPGFSTSAAKAGRPGVPDWQQIERPKPQVHAGPRWCPHCEIMKPDRTHHCRHCGTCVMQFDHHCMWIGQCVGWGNHKFFIAFNFWTVLFTGYTLSFLAAYTAKGRSVDGEAIAIIVICAFFFLVTVAMLSTHIQLIITGRSTLESFASRDQHDRENALLQQHYGTFMHNLEKRKVRKRWRDEYGHVGVDMRWRWGTKMQLWEQEMGRSWLGWILPIGRPLGDGIHFQANPHFGPNGEWLKKKDWPKELQQV